MPIVVDVFNTDLNDEQKAFFIRTQPQEQLNEIPVHVEPATVPLIISDPRED